MHKHHTAKGYECEAQGVGSHLQADANIANMYKHHAAKGFLPLTPYQGRLSNCLELGFRVFYPKCTKTLGFYVERMHRTARDTGYGEGLGALFIGGGPPELEWPRTRARLLRPKSPAFVGALDVYGAAR